MLKLNETFADGHETEDHSKQTTKSIIKKLLENITKNGWVMGKTQLRRCKEALAATTFMYLHMCMPFITLLLAVFLLPRFNYIAWVCLLMYISYIFVDQRTRRSIPDGNGCMYLRNNSFTDHIRNYFPIELVKTAELEPNRNYLLASFPHGIFAAGISATMGLNIGKWLELFPGIRPKVARLNVNFFIPLVREFLHMIGAVSCNKESLIYHLSKSNDPKDKANRDGFTSNAIALVVGGAEESFHSHPGRYILILKSRKGFVKVAITTGSPIVPTFAFGEVDIIYRRSNPSSLLRNYRKFLKKLTGGSPVILFGQGMFPFSLGVVPDRKRIVQVVGAPIEVEKNSNPSPEYVDEIQQKVIDSLKEMFNKYKHKYIENAEQVELIIN